MDYEHYELEAFIIAEQAHRGQVRRDGSAYIVHPFRVARQVSSTHLKAVAWLHDVVEDTSVTLDWLSAKGFPGHVISSVDCLTHREDESYDDYLKRILTNEDAIRVKIADILDNLNDAPTEKQKEKYNKAITTFVDAGYTYDPR